MKYTECKAKDKKYIIGNYPRYPLMIKSGHGCTVKDDTGKEYLDFLSGIGVSVLGHQHKNIIKAITTQTGKILHTSNLYYSQPMVDFAEMLVHNAFSSKVFFCNSGAEANEAAIKLARLVGLQYGKTKNKIITIKNSFHGRTLGALAATGQKKFHAGYAPLPGGFIAVTANDTKALKKAIDKDTCAVLFECIQGEAGVYPLSKDFVKTIYTASRKNDAIMIIDEVQTGFGRTGKLFAYQHFGIKPDIMTLSKGIAGGLPMGAMLARPHLAKLFEPDKYNALTGSPATAHASTFGGNPVCAAAALAVLKQLTVKGYLNKITYLGRYMKDRLSRLSKKIKSVITDVRGMGFMIALDISLDAPSVRNTVQKKGLLINSIGTHTLRMLPPLIAGKKDIDKAISILDEALGDVKILTRGR